MPASAAATRARQLRHAIRVLRSGWLIGLAGCGAVRSQATSVGTDIVDALRAQEPELFEIERRLADSAAAFVGQAVNDQVLVRAKGTWDTMLLRLNTESRVAVGRVAQGVERDLNRSIQVLIGENLELANNRLNALTRNVATRAREDVDPLIDGLAGSVERALRERLRPVLIEIISEASDSVARKVQAIDRLVAQSETGARASQLLWGTLLGLGAVVVIGGLVWRHNSMRDKQAWQTLGEDLDPGQRGALKQRLEDKGFGGQAKKLD